MSRCDQVIEYVCTQQSLKLRKSQNRQCVKLIHRQNFVDNMAKLQDGHYKVTGNWYQLLLVNGDKGMIKLSLMGDLEAEIKYGDFGDTDDNIKEATGQDKYNIQLTFTAEGQTVHELGVITEEGQKISTKSMMGGIAVFEKISDEEAKAMEDDGDPIDAPPSSYKVQPENQTVLVDARTPTFLLTHRIHPWHK